MDLANFWIIEKQLVHKLFKVLVPRYQNYTTSFTKLHKAPNIYPTIHYDRAILELKGRFYFRDSSMSQAKILFTYAIISFFQVTYIQA